jgi:hypothetical protein
MRLAPIHLLVLSSVFHTSTKVRLAANNMNKVALKLYAMCVPDHVLRAS